MLTPVTDGEILRESVFDAVAGLKIGANLAARAAKRGAPSPPITMVLLSMPQVAAFRENMVLPSVVLRRDLAPLRREVAD